MNNGLTTIENVRDAFQWSYDTTGLNIRQLIKLKAWLQHSESRHKNNNLPFTFGNYTARMRPQDYIQQIELGVINCDDIGGKEGCVEYLKKWI